VSDRFGDESCSGMGEMDVVPDVYGALRGLRSFDLDRDTGYLTGVYFKVRWVEGDMEAQCLQTMTAKVTPVHAMYPLARYAQRAAGRPDHRGYDFRDGVPALKEDHSPAPCPGLARGDHGCGFYAQHGDKMPPKHYVSGVVEMFGQIELGPLGLRSSKARLVALARPEAFGTRPANLSVNSRAVERYQEQLSAALDAQPVPPNPWWANVKHLGAHERAMEKWKTRLDNVSKWLLDSQERETEATHDLEMWDSTTKWLYPTVPQFESLDSMLEAYPVPPLDHLFKEDQ